MATKQGLYTGAMTAIGERKVLTSENVEPRRVLDDAYDQVLEECLSAASWNFAMETIKSTADTGTTPNFGFTEVFAKPGDWLRTHALSEDEYFSQPLIHYYDDSNFWSADVSPVYIRYVSNDASLGLDLTRWPSLFARYVELALAARVCFRLTKDVRLADYLANERDKALKKAKNADAMNEANPKFNPPGTWTASRSGGSGRERGSRSNLTG